MSAATRIGWIRFKDGRPPIRMLPQPVSVGLRRILIEQIVEALDDCDGELAGYAFVLWDKHAAFIANAGSSRENTVPQAMIADFARNALNATWIEVRAANYMNEWDGEPAA